MSSSPPNQIKTKSSQIKVHLFPMKFSSGISFNIFCQTCFASLFGSDRLLYNRFPVFHMCHLPHDPLYNFSSCISLCFISSQLPLTGYLHGLVHYISLLFVILCFNFSLPFLFLPLPACFFIPFWCLGPKTHLWILFFEVLFPLNFNIAPNYLFPFMVVLYTPSPNLKTFSPTFTYFITSK